MQRHIVIGFVASKYLYYACMWTPLMLESHAGRAKDMISLHKGFTPSAGWWY